MGHGGNRVLQTYASAGTNSGDDDDDDYESLRSLMVPICKFIGLLIAQNSSSNYWDDNISSPVIIFSCWIAAIVLF